MPKVSVVIVCHNLARYLRECLGTVLEQTPEDLYEIIVIDDASTDQTQDLCQQIERNNSQMDNPRHITVHRNSTNLHVSRSRNLGISMATGKYILPLDADDILRPGALVALSQALDNDRLLDIAYGSMDVLEEDGRIWTSGWPPKDFSYEGQMTGKNQLPYASMYRREVWERVGGYRPGYESVEDALFWTQATALSFKPRKVTEAATLLYRMRSDSLSHQVDASTLRPWWQLAPRKAQWTPYTYEPVRISVVIDAVDANPEDVLHTIDCVWSQTFSQWNCIIANGNRTIYPPFVEYVTGDSGDDNITGELVAYVPAGTHIDNSYLERVWKRWSDEKSIDCPRLEIPSKDCGEAKMACGTCGKSLAGIAVAQRSFVNRSMGVTETPGQEEGKMLVEFIGEGGWTVKGPVTGNVYYFDVMSGHRIKNLWATDAKVLIGTYDTLLKEYNDAGAPA